MLIMNRSVTIASRRSASRRQAIRPAAAFLAACLILCGGGSDSSGHQTGPSPPETKPPTQWPKEIDGYDVYQIGKDKAGDLDFSKLVEILLVVPKRVTTESLSVGLKLQIHPVPVGGEIHALRFDKMKLNDVPFELAEYRKTFPIPRKTAKLLPGGLDLTVKFADLQPALLRNLTDPDKELTIEGTIIVFGSFRKFLIPFKRAVPVELKTSRPNPFANFPSLKAVIELLERRP